MSRVVKGCFIRANPCFGWRVFLFCVPESLLTNRHNIDIFLALIISAMEVGNTRPTAHPPESVAAKIHEVNYYSMASSVWDDLSIIWDNLPTFMSTAQRMTINKSLISGSQSIPAMLAANHEGDFPI